MLPRLAVLALVAANLLFPAAGAEGLPVRKPAESREKAAIREVIADPVFGIEKEETEWRYTGSSWDNASDTSTTPSSWMETLGHLIESFSKLLRILMWVAGALLLSALVYLSYRHRHTWFGSLKTRAAPPDFLFGLDVRPESLPDDVVAAALLELARGSAPRALSLLYRAALVSLIHRSQLDFHAGHTEDDCLRLVRSAVDPGCSAYFAELLEAWKLTAYAHEAPPAPALESLCHRWRAHFAHAGHAR